MNEIRLTGREISIPGDINHALQCTVDGQPITVTVADLDGSKKTEMSQALSVSLESNRAGVRRAILEALRTALQTQGDGAVH
ncbi:MAG: hypothetical protein V1876_00110 [Candidatus Peregrinibacteria bacterium]